MRRRGWMSFAVFTLAGSAAVAQPVNDSCESAIDLTHEVFPFVSGGVSVLDAAAGSERPMGCEAAGYTIWYKFVPAVAGGVEVSTCAADAPDATLPDTVFTLYLSSGASCGALTPIACSDDACGLRSRAAATVVAGTTYFIQIGKFGAVPPVAGSDVISFSLTGPMALPPDGWIEQRDAGESLGDAQVPQGNGVLGGIGGRLDGAESDLYAIEVCDAGGFSAAVRANPEFDSQIFLFDAQGMGVAFNDDDGASLLSRLGPALVATTGLYYIGVSEFDRDPMSEDGLELWEDGPSGQERGPDGPGSSSPLGGWTSGGFAGSSYAIEFTGVCFPNLGTCWGNCPADYDRNGGVDGQDVEMFFRDWEPANDCADTNRDGSVDGADVEAFIRVWENGGC